MYSEGLTGGQRVGHLPTHELSSEWGVCKYTSLPLQLMSQMWGPLEKLNINGSVYKGKAVAAPVLQDAAPPADVDGSQARFGHPSAAAKSQVASKSQVPDEHGPMPELAHVAMGHNLWRSHFGADEHPFATYFDVHQGYRVLTHSHVPGITAGRLSAVCLLAEHACSAWAVRK